jgi:hypothetical protein
MGRRDKNDLEWMEVKKKVWDRDSHCRLIEVLSMREDLILQKSARNMLSKCDPAHVFGVGAHLKLCYDVDNVYKINHWSHTMLDSMHNPIDGSSINHDEHEQWWIRIIGLKMYDTLLDRLKEDKDGSSDQD